MMFTAKKLFKICREKGFDCYYCGKPAETLDHFKPLKSGGLDKDKNLIPSCRLCNRLKRAFDLETFRQIVIRRKYKIPYFKKEQLEFLKSKGFKFEQYKHEFYFEKKNLKI